MLQEGASTTEELVKICGCHGDTWIIERNKSGSDECNQFFLKFNWCKIKAYLLCECLATHDIKKMNKYQICNICKLGKFCHWSAQQIK